MAETRRNVLLIVCDQLRADFLEAYGGPAITPNVSRLAREGAVFERAYSSSPMCVPARMTMLTGRHSLTCPSRIPDEVPTIAGTLGEAGHHTAAFGKMHMEPPRGPYGFRELVLAEDTGENVPADDYHRELAAKGLIEWGHGRTNYDLRSAVSKLPEAHSVTQWNGDRAVAFLEARQKTTAPFYGVISFLKPHPPYDPTPRWAGLVSPEQAPAPSTLERPAADYPEAVRRYREAAGCGRMPADQIQQTRAHYLGLVAQIDAQLGRILDTLESTGLADKTLVVFTSDHGDLLGDHHLFMKFYPYEPSARIPLILRGPGIVPGRYDVPVSTLDLVPTALEFCGMPHAFPCQGDSLARLADGSVVRDGVLTCLALARGACWATRRWKYTFWSTGEEELFDLQNDPNEAKNLAQEQPDRKAQMQQALTAELARLDADRIGDTPPILRDNRLRVAPLDPARFAKAGTRPPINPPGLLPEAD